MPQLRQLEFDGRANRGRTGAQCGAHRGVLRLAPASPARDRRRCRGTLARTARRILSRPRRRSGARLARAHRRRSGNREVDILLLQVASAMARDVGRVLYVSGEESERQIKMRAQRLVPVGDNGSNLPEDLFLLTETDLHAILGHVEQLAPRVLVIDSIQTAYLSRPRRPTRPSATPHAATTLSREHGSGGAAHARQPGLGRLPHLRQQRKIRKPLSAVLHRRPHAQIVVRLQRQRVDRDRGAGADASCRTATKSAELRQRHHRHHRVRPCC